MKLNSTMEQSSASQKKHILIWILVFVFAIIGISVFIAISSYQNSHIEINGHWYSSDIKEIDLQNSGITNISDIRNFRGAKFIDLRHNALSPEDITSLSEALPDCTILWSVPLGDSFTDSNARSITLTEYTDIGILRYFTELESIDARGLDYEYVSSLLEEFKDCTVLWDIAIGDERYAPSETKLVFGDIPAEDVRNLLLFDSLESVDASGCTAYDALMEVSNLLPECDFTWTVDLGGFTVTNKDTELNFNRTPVAEITALDSDFEKLKYLPNLTHIDMCGCGVSNEQMASWRDEYPQCKFVWEVTFGNKKQSWTVRTDIQVFSSLLYSYTKVGDQDDYMNLFLYCTDLVALDLGHNYITDISALSNLKKLQALILTDNPITDITALGELPELIFLELRKMDITDVSPLTNCKKLMHLDISDTLVRNLKPLCECTWLDSLYYFYSCCGNEQLSAFKKAVPTASLYYRDADVDKANDAMRLALKDAFINYESIVEYISWDNIIYK